MKKAATSANLPSAVFVLAILFNAVAICWVDNLIFKILLSVSLSLLLVGALEAVHQATHNNLFSAQWANRWIGTLLALILLLNFVRYRAFHAYHHAHTATHNDPERVLYLDADARSLRSLLLAPIFFLSFALTIEKSKYVASRLRRSASINTLLLLAFIVGVIILTALMPQTMLFLYWVPLAFFAWFDFLLNQAEHYGMKEIQTGENLRQVTNNLLLPKPLALLFLYRNLHQVHHIEPRTLWHRSEVVYWEQGNEGITFWSFFRRYLAEGPRLWGVR